MQHKYVFGDCHGRAKAVKQAFERAGADIENDWFIGLGDVVDRGPESFEVVEFLLKIKNLIMIRGNHDEPFIEFLKGNGHTWNWQQGGDETLLSYKKNCQPQGGILDYRNIPQSHKDFFFSMVDYYKDQDNNIFVHGGFNRHYLLTQGEKVQKSDLLQGVTNSVHWFSWDRDLWAQAMSFAAMNKGSQEKFKFKIKEPHKEVFIGHTPTIVYDKIVPMNAGPIWNIDTGAGFSQGKFTIMNIETKEFFQSDLIKDLYGH